MLNYIDFETAIPLFRESDQQLKVDYNVSSIKSNLYILTDFELTKNYDIGGGTIFKSEQKFIVSNTFSNLSNIQVPKWLKRHKNEEYASACFGLILSSLISLATERSVKFYRDYYNIGGIESVSIHHPLQHSGPGAIDRPDEKTVDLFMKNVRDLYKITQTLEYSDYTCLVRSCRLFQLAQLSRYIDHNLSYSLMVSSIEANATKAIKIDKIEPDWKEIKQKIKSVADQAGLDADFRSTLNIKLEQHYSGSRFQKFMLYYAPIESLNLASRYDKMSLLPEEKEAFEPMDYKIDPINNFIHMFRQNPNFLEMFKKTFGMDFEKILKDSYKYRSDFYHEGKANQFSSPDSYDRYTKTITVKESYPFVLMEDFKHLSLDTKKLLTSLIEAKYITEIKGKKHYFDRSKILEIQNDFFGNHGRDITQVFYQKEVKSVTIASFSLLAQISRISAMNYYNKKTNNTV